MFFDELLFWCGSIVRSVSRKFSFVTILYNLVQHDTLPFYQSGIHIVSIKTFLVGYIGFCHFCGPNFDEIGVVENIGISNNYQ